MGSAPAKPRRREGLYFDDNDAVSPDVSDDDDRPNQVRHFSFKNITCFSFDVSWDPPPNTKIKEYQLRIFPPEGIRSKSLISSLTSSSYTFERLTSGTRYTVGVVAITEDGKRSTCSSASESTLPRAPTELTFPSKQTTSSTVGVAWKQSRGDREYYEVSISPTEGVTGKTLVSDLQESHNVFTGLVPGTEYKVTVVSVANGRKSEPLEGAIVTNPGHVYDLSFPNVTHSEMQLVWKPPLGKVDCYTLELTSENSEEEPVVIRKIKQTQYKFNGLVSGRNYQCYIITHALEKTSSREVFEQCTIPNQVMSLSVAILTTDQASITWSTPPGDFESYDLFLNPREGVECDPCPRGLTANSHTFRGLNPGTKYTVGVVTNSKDKISQRAVIAFITEPEMCGQISFPPDKLKSTQIGLEWLPARGELDSYTILVMKDGGAGGVWTQSDIIEPSYTFTDLTPGAEYTFNVTTLREGKHSEAKPATCSTLPCPAGDIEFPSGGTTPNSIKVSWAPSAGGVDSYKIVVLGEGTKLEKLLSFDTSEYTITNLRPGTEYNISVTVISYGVESEPSIATWMTGPDCVTNLKAKAVSKNEIYVKWSSPNGGADTYDIRISSNEGVYSEIESKNIKETEYTFERLTPGALYTIAVIPVARNVRGKATEVYGYTKPGDILNVHIPSDEVTDDLIKVVWGVEGKSKEVLATLLLEEEGNAQKVTANITNSSEHVFSDLEKNKKYTIKLQAIGSTNLAPAGGEGSRGSEISIIHETATLEKHDDEVKKSLPVDSTQDEIKEATLDSTLPGDVTHKVEPTVNEAIYTPPQKAFSSGTAGNNAEHTESRAENTEILSEKSDNLPKQTQISTNDIDNSAESPATNVENGNTPSSMSKSTSDQKSVSSEKADNALQDPESKTEDVPVLPENRAVTSGDTSSHTNNDNNTTENSAPKDENDEIHTDRSAETPQQTALSSNSSGDEEKTNPLKAENTEVITQKKDPRANNNAHPNVPSIEVTAGAENELYDVITEPAAAETTTTETEKLVIEGEAETNKLDKNEDAANSSPNDESTKALGKTTTPTSDDVINSTEDRKRS